MRLSLLLLALCLQGAPAIAQEAAPDAFRATTEVADGEFVLKGRGYHRSSPAPLVIEDLPPGRYWISLYRDRDEVSKIRLDAGSELELEDRRGSRAALSTMFPGLGQLRDLHFFSGLVPFVEVGSSLAQTLRFAGDVGNAEDERDQLRRLRPSDPGELDEWQLALDRTEDDIWLAERTRNHYAILTAYQHVGNILHAATRRGPLRFQLSGTYSLAVNYRPPSRPWVGMLSLLYPGLGQTRIGHETRGLIWSGLGFLGAVGLIEAQRELDYRQTVSDDLGRQATLEIAGGGLTRETLGKLSAADSERNSAKGRRNGAAVALGAIWILNVADAVFLSDMPPIPLRNGRIAGIPLRIDPTWVGEGPGLALSGRF